MTFEEDLRDRVVTSAVGEQLGRWEGERATHWGDRPPGAPAPAIVFTMIDAGLDYTHGGRDALRITQIQADVLAESYGQARAIADDLGQLLEGSAEVNGRFFSHGFIDHEQDVPVADVRGARAIYGRTLRLSIYHKE